MAQPFREPFKGQKPGCSVSRGGWEPRSVMLPPALWLRGWQGRDLGVCLRHALRSVITERGGFGFSAAPFLRCFLFDSEVSRERFLIWVEFMSPNCWEPSPWCGRAVNGDEAQHMGRAQVTDVTD